jgi:ubiquitin-protein ligase
MLRTTSRYRRVTNELKNYNEKNNTFFLIENNTIANPVQTLDIKYTTFGKFFNNDDDRLAIIKLEYPDTYPFSKPNITINGHEYISLLYMDGNWMKKFNIDMCLCCNSILCKWGPHIKINNILDEICTNLNYKIRIIEILLCKQVVKQKFGFYIPIEEFL